ncbi:hypothetical protein ACFW04_000117 [Cataglyphis niger]
MSNKIEYLVKYSVAPPPSRDYYGLKILQDEVILYLWKISHGPHKAPIVRRAKFIEFNQEKSLQDEIRYGFGKYLLKHVKNIAEGNRNTLLTLPKNLIGRISRYLKFTDIIKLSSLSHVACEVFNTDSIWQILYKRDKKVSFEERERARIYGWKQLYKDKQMQMSMKDQKNLRVPIKFTNNVVKTNKLSQPTHIHTNTNDASKSISKTTSITNIIPKKRTESSSLNLVTIPLPKTISDTRFRTNVKNEKLIPQKKNVGNISSTFNENEKHIKKENFIALKTTTKPEAKNLSRCDKLSNKQQNKSEKCFNKIDNTSNRKSISLSQESKLKSTTSKMSFSKNTMANAKSSSNLMQNPHNKTRSKTKTKSKKKITATKSEIFNTDEALPDNSFTVEDNNFDLADLIEASLKNIRSPRSVFDYDFSCIEQSDTIKRDTLKIRNEIQNINIDKLKQLKPFRNNVTNNFSNKIIRGGEILEKLSERSESFNETSNESLVNDKKSVPDGHNKPLLSEKYLKARADLQQSLDWRRNISVSPEDRWKSCSAVNFLNKSLNSKNIDNSDEKFSIPREPSKASSLLKISNGLESRKNILARSSKIIK